MLVGLILVIGCGGLGGSGQEEQLPPNIVLIVVDTLRADRVGVYGGNQETPNVDWLALEGTRFLRARSNIPITGPSHASMFTGQLPVQHGIKNNTEVLPHQLTTVAEVLKDQGYQTAGTVSLGNLRRQFGFSQGFERYDDHFTTEWFRPADRITDAAIKLLQEFETGKPSFLFVHYSDPHEPYAPPTLRYPKVVVSMGGETVGTVAADGFGKRLQSTVGPGEHLVTFSREKPDGAENWRLVFRFLGVIGSEEVRLRLADGWRSELNSSPATIEVAALPASVVVENHTDELAPFTLKFFVEEEISVPEARSRYDGEVEFVDLQIGRLIDFLRNSGRLENTVIVLTSDHGEGLGDHGLLGHIHQLYESLLHVPLIIYGMSGFRNSEIEAPVSLVSIGATILDIAGIDQPDTFRYPSLLGDSSSWGVGTVAMTFKPEAARDLFAFVDGRFKVIAGRSSSQYEAYDLLADPDEVNDLFPEREDLKAAMEQALEPLLRAEVERAGASALDDEDRQKLEALGYVH